MSPAEPTAAELAELEAISKDVRSARNHMLIALGSWLMAVLSWQGTRRQFRAALAGVKAQQPIDVEPVEISEELAATRVGSFLPAWAHLERNPEGAWSIVDTETGQPITAAVDVAGLSRRSDKYISALAAELVRPIPSRSPDDD